MQLKPLHDAILMHHMALIEEGTERLIGWIVWKTVRKFIGRVGRIVTFQAFRAGLRSVKDWCCAIRREADLLWKGVLRGKMVRVLAVQYLEQVAGQVSHCFTPLVPQKAQWAILQPLKCHGCMQGVSVQVFGGAVVEGQELPGPLALQFGDDWFGRFCTPYCEPFDAAILRAAKKAWHEKQNPAKEKENHHDHMVAPQQSYHCHCVNKDLCVKIVAVTVSLVRIYSNDNRIAWHGNHHYIN